MPASLVFNWHNEINKFAPQLTVYRHTGSKRHRDIRLLSRFDILLTTYQTALRDVDMLGQLEYEYVVLDESQQIKNKNSKIFKAVNELVANHKISLSGTPIENSLSDLWAQMQFINPNLLGSYNFFQRNFIQPIEKQGDESVTDQLKTMIAPYLLRRTKEMVAKDLPELDTRVFYSEMSVEQKRLYEKEKSAVRNYLFENYAPHDLGYNNIVIRALTKLRQIANHPRLVYDDYSKRSGKFDDISEQLDVVIRGNHKVLLFSSFVQHLQLFRNKLEKSGRPYTWLSGENTPAQREEAIKRFEQEEDTRIFLISLKAGGSGLNLTAADYVFITDPWWNPAAENQAIARAHRIGQTRNVFATKFITKDSIEEKILSLQEKKSKLFHDIIEGHAKFRFTRQELGYLLE
jgi:SNF2 family DNA or RNA helicase